MKSPSRRLLLLPVFWLPEGLALVPHRLGERETPTPSPDPRYEQERAGRWLRRVAGLSLLLWALRVDVYPVSSWQMYA